MLYCRSKGNGRDVIDFQHLGPERGISPVCPGFPKRSRGPRPAPVLSGEGLDDRLSDLVGVLVEHEVTAVEIAQVGRRHNQLHEFRGRQNTVRKSICSACSALFVFAACVVLTQCTCRSGQAGGSWRLPAFLLFIEIVVFVVLRTLQSCLEGETILGDLVDPYTRFNLGRSRVGSARFARLGGSICLR